MLTHFHIYQNGRLTDRGEALGGGLESRAWRARERGPITGVWGQSALSGG